MPFPFVSFALVGGVGCLLCKTNKMEGGGCHNRPPSRKNSLPGGWMESGGHSGFIPHITCSISAFSSPLDAAEGGAAIPTSFGSPRVFLNHCDFRKSLALCRFRSSPFVLSSRWKLPKQWQDRELAKAKHHSPNAAGFLLPIPTRSLPFPPKIQMEEKT